MEYYLGQIGLFAINFQPRGWILCDGKILNIQNHQELFGILGARFGGDGVRYFALPDLRTSMFGDLYDLKIRYYICIDGIWPQSEDVQA